MSEEFTGSALEADEVKRAGTPLSIKFEIVGCEYATPAWVGDNYIPVFTFRPTCPFGKTQPNQECRECRHSRLYTLGNQDGNVRGMRYPGHGAVFPIDEDMADKITDITGAPLRRPAWEVEE